MVSRTGAPLAGEQENLVFTKLRHEITRRTDAISQSGFKYLLKRNHGTSVGFVCDVGKPLAVKLLPLDFNMFDDATMNKMKFEPYQPIPADAVGLLATVGIGDDDYTYTLYLAAVLIFESFRLQRFTGEVEFYSSANKPESDNCKIGMGFRKLDLSLTSTDWPKWEKSSMESIRQKCKCMGAVNYHEGCPVSILEHRPVSPFIQQIEAFCDPSSYVHMHDPLDSGYLTEKLFLELTKRAFLAKDFNGDGFEVAGDDTRLIQWHDLPGEAKSQQWYIFRNKAHHDSFIGEKASFQDTYPLKYTGHDPFYSDSSENLRRQREIILSRQKASLAGGVKTA